MNMDEIKARLQQLNNRNKKQNDLWKPTDEHDVRAVPHKYGKGDDPFVELFFHYEIGNEKPILCPKQNFGDDCDICDFSEQLRAWKDQNGNDKREADRKADWEIFKKISAKNCYLFPVVERGKEDELAKWCRINPTNYTVLLNICADAENNTDREDGGGIEVLFSTKSAYDLHVSFKKKGEKGNNKTFNIVEFKEKKKTSKLHNDPAVVEKILASVKSIGDVYPRMTSAEVSKAFKRFAGTVSNESKADGGTEYKPNSGEQSRPGVGQSIDEGLKDLLGDE